MLEAADDPFIRMILLSSNKQPFFDVYNVFRFIITHKHRRQEYVVGMLSEGSKLV